MAEQTLEQKLELAQKQIEAQAEIIAKHEDTIERQGKQIDSMRATVAAAESGKVNLPEGVEADARERMAAGIPRDIAIELALNQHAHSKNLAKAKAGAATETKTGKAK